MAYSFDFQPELDLVVVVFAGSIPREEESEAFRAVMEDERLRPNSKFLVDRSASEMEVTPDDVQPHMELIQQHADRLGKPRMAIVAPRSYDFAMLRVLEMSSENEIDHDYYVFKTVDEACGWLGVDQADVAWPTTD